MSFLKSLVAQDRMLQCQIRATETVSGCLKALRLGLLGSRRHESLVEEMDKTERIAHAYVRRRGIEQQEIQFDSDGTVPPDFLVHGRAAIEVRRNAAGQPREGVAVLRGDSDVAGLEPDHYALTAVKHRERDGGVHVHVLAARCDVETGRSLTSRRRTGRRLPRTLRGRWG